MGEGGVVTLGEVLEEEVCGGGVEGVGDGGGDEEEDAGVSDDEGEG